MFGSKRTAADFIDTLRDIANKTEGKAPKTLNTSLNSLLKRMDGFDGQTVDDLVTHLTTKKRVTKKPRAASKTKLRPASKALTNEILNGLKKAEANEDAFSKAVAEAKKTCGAATLRDVAAEYAAIAKPRTKGDALKAILSARASRIRMQAKRDQSSKATPW